MEYRQLPRGTENERFSVLGLGFGGIGTTLPEEIEAIVRKAMDHGINFFDNAEGYANGRAEQVMGDDGTLSFVPNANIFLAALGVAVLLAAFLVFVLRKMNKSEATK